MVKYYQAFNPLKDCWVKYKKKKNGQTEIVNIKQKNPLKPFKGVKKKKKY